jgi:hypothetical protein
MGGFIRKLFGGGGSKPKPKPKPVVKAAPKISGPSAAQIAQANQRRKGKTTYTNVLGLSTGQKSQTNLKVLTGA